MVCDENKATLFASDRLSHLNPAEYSCHSPLQAVPTLVPIAHHVFEFARSVSAVLSGQTAVLFVDQLQLSQPFMNLSLECLREEMK